MDLMNEAYTNSGQPARFTQGTIDLWRNDAGKNPLMYPNTNWAKEVFHTAVANNHNVSLSGGGEKSTFYTSIGYNNNPGIMETSGFERYIIRSNVETRVTPFTLGARLNGYLAKVDSGQNKN